MQAVLNYLNQGLSDSIDQKMYILKTIILNILILLKGLPFKNNMFI